MLNEIKSLSPEKKQHLIAVGMGTVMALAVVYLVLISPAQENLKKLGAQTAEAEKKYTEADRLVKRTQTVHEDYEKLNEHLAAIEGTMASGDLVQWIRSTEIKFRAQAPYKVEIPNFPFRGQGDMNMIPDYPYKAAAYGFSGSAYFHDLGKYLADWENQFPYMRVLGLEMSPDESATAASTATGDEREKLIFNFEVSALVKPPKRN
jgi:hypothetical protein